ncbi:MAG: GDP-mannose 4,6-dehydratase, partial [SAR324 cluster bacterium]|nr:GDP-mannose 4,6-dehydratase [SAR324 cluster bacterium]
FANKLCVNDHSCPSSISQYAGLEALQGPQDEVNKIVKEFEKRRNFIFENLNKLKKIFKGSEMIFHLAANADVRYGYKNPFRDLEQNTITTYNVLEAMKKNNWTRNIRVGILSNELLEWFKTQS